MAKEGMVFTAGLNSGLSRTVPGTVRGGGRGGGGGEQRRGWGHKDQERPKREGESTGGKEKSGGEKARERKGVEISITKHCHPFSFSDKQLTCQCIKSTFQAYF